MSEPVPVAVVGAGHMGRHHVRKYAGLPQARLVAVVDLDEDRARAAAEPHGARWLTDLAALPDEVVAVSVATPTVTHLDVARPLIQRGVHVLIEKPIADSLEAARTIAALARESGVIVAVGHTERFNPVVAAVERLGVRPKFVETQRVSPFPFRAADVGVVLDMMIHDIDIVLHLVGDAVTKVDAVGVNVLSRHEDIANVRLAFERGAVANLTASRLALKTERRLRVFSERAYVSLDYHNRRGIAITLEENLDILRIAREHGLEDLSQAAGMDFGRLVHVEPLAIQDADPLETELRTFLECVQTGTRPPVSAEDGVAAVEVAERIMASIRQHAWDGHPEGRVGLEADIVGRQLQQRRDAPTGPA